MGTPFEEEYRYRLRIEYWYVSGTP
ncbi:hypothetical protein A2U01_0059547, partial [Trifolium medium]|nr:hypothetical protein [Trifolium medium]